MESVLRFATNHAEANFLLAMAQAHQGITESSLPFYRRAIDIKPALDKLPDYFDLLSRNYFQNGLYEQALATAEKAQQLATVAGRQEQAAKLRQRVEQCRAKLPDLKKP